MKCGPPAVISRECRPKIVKCNVINKRKKEIEHLRTVVHLAEPADVTKVVTPSFARLTIFFQQGGNAIGSFFQSRM